MCKGLKKGPTGILPDDRVLGSSRSRSVQNSWSPQPLCKESSPLWQAATHYQLHPFIMSHQSSLLILTLQMLKSGEILKFAHWIRYPVHGPAREPFAKTAKMKSHWEHREESEFYFLRIESYRTGAGPRQTHTVLFSVTKSKATEWQGRKEGLALLFALHFNLQTWKLRPREV